MPESDETATGENGRPKSYRQRVAEDLLQTTEPTAAELNAIREYDKERFWTS